MERGLSGALDPKQEPLFSCVHFARLLLVDSSTAGGVEILLFAQHDNRSLA